MPRPVGKGAGNKRCFCPSVRLSRTQRIIREPKGLACPNSEGRFPTLDATRIPVSRSKVRGQTVKVTSRLTQTHKMCHIFRTVRHTNFKVGVGMEDVDSQQGQASWPPRLKVKVNKVTWYVWPVRAILQNLHLVLWQSTKTRMTDNRGYLQGQRSRS